MEEQKIYFRVEIYDGQIALDALQCSNRDPPRHPAAPTTAIRVVAVIGGVPSHSSTQFPCDPSSALSPIPIRVPPVKKIFLLFWQIFLAKCIDV